jgi:hypothetical protein
VRARLAALLIVIGAAALPASLFFDWFKLSGQAGAVSMTGWQAFETVDLLLVLAALVGFASLRLPQLRTRSGVVPLVALVVAGAILLQIIEPPPLLSAYEEGGDVSVTREVGAWVGLGGAVLLLVAGLLRSRTSSG